MTMNHAQSFSSLDVEIGGTSGVWDLPTFDDPTLDSLPPPNLPHSPLPEDLPLSIPQLINKYYKNCFHLIGVDTCIALICFGVCAPYMVFAAYAGNYATLAKGVRSFPSWMDNLERIDTIIIGVCLISLFAWEGGVRGEGVKRYKSVHWMAVYLTYLGIHNTYLFILYLFELWVICGDEEWKVEKKSRSRWAYWGGLVRGGEKEDKVGKCVRMSGFTFSSSSIFLIFSFLFVSFAIRFLGLL